MKGKICLVTGATAGIGKVTAHELARRGARVLAIARDAQKAEATVAEIKASVPDANIAWLLCDLSSQASIRKLAAEVRSNVDCLHVLINNAGAILGERRVTMDGLETTFATNHLAYFLLTHLLLDLLRASAPARIVNVASDAHRGAPLDFDDLQYERRPYSPWGAYGSSKLANIAWSAELARRLEGTGVTANSLHPGVIASNFGKEGPFWMRHGLKLVGAFLTSPEKGAATSLHLATSPAVEGMTGLYFKSSKPTKPTAQAQAPETGQQLWKVSEELVARSAV